MESGVRDKHIAITGATSGIGRATALELARQGAGLTLFCRNPDKANTLAEEICAGGNKAPVIIQMDMADLSSVRRAALELLQRETALDILLNNAGVVNTRRLETVDGFEHTLAVNHFAPFLLTGLLLPLLGQAGAGRIINVASDAHAFVKSMGFDDMHATRGYKTFQVYGRSKLANILFTRSLAGRIPVQRIAVNCLHPGAVATSLGRQNSGLLSAILPSLLKPFFRSPLQGAATSLHLCCDEEGGRVTGAYFKNCRQVTPRVAALDDEAAKKLWDFTEQSIGYTFPPL